MVLFDRQPKMSCQRNRIETNLDQNSSSPTSQDDQVSSKKETDFTFIDELDRQLTNYELEEQRLIEQQIQLYRQKRSSLVKKRVRSAVSKKVAFEDASKGNSSEKDKLTEEADEADEEKKQEAEKFKRQEEQKRKQEELRRKRIELQKRKERILSNKKRITETVEQLLVSKVERQEFLDKVAILCKSEYDDVIVERSIIKMCGYALCTNELTDGSKRSQRFKIVLQSQQVFDISERKMFCSNVCFARSQHVKQQLHEQPLWMREDEQSKKSSSAVQPLAKEITLYEGNKGAHGTEVQLGISLVRQLAENVSEQGDQCRFYHQNSTEKRSDLNDIESKESTLTLNEKQIKTGNFIYIRPENLTQLQTSMQKLQIKEKSKFLPNKLQEKPV